MSNLHTLFFKIVLYFCFDLIRHNIGITLKHNKFLFLLLFVIIFTYLQLLSNVSQDLQAMKPPPILLTDERCTKFIHAI